MPSNTVDRRTVLIALAGVAPMLLVGEAAAGTLAKSAVNYEDSSSSDKKCADCKFFIAPNDCKQVKGPISPNGHCKLWTKNA